MKMNKKNVKLVLVLLMVMICLAIAVLALNVRRESAFLLNSDGTLKKDLKDLKLNPDIVNQVIPDVYKLDLLFDMNTKYMNRLNEFFDFDKAIITLEAGKAAGELNDSTQNINELMKYGDETRNLGKIPQNFLKKMKEHVKKNSKALPSAIVQHHVERIETYARDVMLPKMGIFEQGFTRLMSKLKDHTISSIVRAYGDGVPNLREKERAILLPFKEYLEEFERNVRVNFTFLNA